MVRRITGTLLMIGLNRLTLEEMEDALKNQQNLEVNIAPPAHVYFCGKFNIQTRLTLANNPEYSSNDWQTFKRLMSHALPYKSIFFWALSVGILMAVVAPLRPLIIQLIIDNSILTYDLNSLQKMSLLLIGILITETLFRYVFSYSTALFRAICN